MENDFSNLVSDPLNFELQSSTTEMKIQSWTDSYKHYQNYDYIILNIFILKISKRLHVIIRV